MTEKLRVGIAGYGIVGKKRRYFADRHPRLKTVAVCDRKNDTVFTDADGLKHFQNYHQLLDEPLDILIVCLTNDIAAEVTMAGLKKGLHVFCEKPPGRNVQDIVDVIRCEKECTDKKLMYGFNHRYHDSVKDALELVREQELGKVINLRGVYGKSVVSNIQGDWRHLREVAGGGILLDQGIHMVDMMRMFVGDFTQIHSFVKNSHWGFDVEDNAYALMQTSEGVVCMLHSSATQWRHRFQLDIALEKGSITLEGILSGTKSYGAETITISRASDLDKGEPLGDPKELKRRYNVDNSWYDEIADFVKAIDDNQPIKFGSSIEALKTMKIVFDIYYADPIWRKKHGIKCNIPEDLL